MILHMCKDMRLYMCMHMKLYILSMLMKLHVIMPMNMFNEHVVKAYVRVSFDQTNKESS